MTHETARTIGERARAFAAQVVKTNPPKPKPTTELQFTFNCGCGFSAKTTPGQSANGVLQEAIKHVSETKHAITIGGMIRPKGEK